MATADKITPVLIETSWNVKNDITKVIEVMKEY